MLIKHLRGLSRCLALAIVFQSSAAFAQDQDALRCLESTCRNLPIREQLVSIGKGHVRGLFGGFEQGAGISGGVQLTSKNDIPGVNLRANFLASTRWNRRVDFEAYVPRVGSSKNHADGWFSYLRRTSNFFGIGPYTTKDFKTDLTTEQRSLQGSFFRDITSDFQSGVYSQVKNTHEWAPGLLSSSKILSYGGFLAYDARDNTQGLTRGAQLFGRVSSNDGLNNHAAFSDFGWNEAEFDARGYIPLAGPDTSLALRSRGQFKRPKGGSRIPFNDLSWLGGREHARGYGTYRFRDRNILMFSTELRRTVQRASDFRGIDVFGFADSGQVWGETPSSLVSSNWNSSAGGGV